MFGFGTPSELTTPIGGMIKSATDSLRISPDWSMNVQICDEIMRNPSEYSIQAIKAIRRRLQDSDQMTVYLALILLETCMKNCSSMDFITAFDRSTMDDVVSIAKGSKGLKSAEEALRLIQDWGRVFEQKQRTFPLFFETYMSMKARGITFPKEDEATLKQYRMMNNSAAAAEKGSAANSNQNSSTRRSSQSASASAAPSSTAAAAASSSSGGSAENMDDFLKLQVDLSVVMEKVKLCREILQVTPGIAQDEALADVIGFLEACRDRMVDVIEAGTSGLFGEDLFALCLKVNDAVSRTLEAERTGKRIAVDEEDSPVPSSTAKASSSSSTSELLDLSEGNTPPPKKTAAAMAPGSSAGKGATTSITEDLFALDLLMKATPTPAPVASRPTAVHATLPPAPAPSSSSSAAAGQATVQVAADAPFDPFGTGFVSAINAPPPAPAPAPTAAPTHNPFDDFGPPPAPVAPSATAAPVSATTVPAVAKVDDLDFLLGVGGSKPATTTTATAPAAATGGAAGGGGDQDFDAFLASLEKKK